MECVLWAHCKAIHIFELYILILRSLENVELRINAMMDAFGKSFDQNLDDSGAMNIQRYFCNIWSKVVD